jgi:hypothetical protein
VNGLKWGVGRCSSKEQAVTKHKQAQQNAKLAQEIAKSKQMQQLKLWVTLLSTQCAEVHVKM